MLKERLKQFSNSNKNEIAFKAISVFLIRVVGYGFGFLFTWIVANKFGAKAQGVFSLAFLFLSIGVMISKLGVETSIVKWIASNNSVNSQKYIYNKCIKTVALSTLIVSIILFVCAPLIAKMYNKPDILLSVKLAALGIPFLAILDVSSNFFKGRKATTIFGLYYHLGKFLAPLLFLTVYYFFNNQSLHVPILTYVLGLFVTVIIIKIHIIRFFRKTDAEKDFNFTTRFIFLESYPMLIASSIVMIMGWSDVFILGFYVSESEIGVYSTAIKIATIVSFTYNAISTIATPKIAEYYKNSDTLKLNETISFSSKLMLICGLPIFILLMVFPEFVLGLFGEEYIAGKNVLRILICAQMTNVITGPVGPIFQMTNNQNKLQLFILISLICNLIISLILVNYYSVIGVALGSAIGMILWNLMGAIYLYKKLNLKTWANF
jgi:O-antigen/teichoic acid export membrane protein